MLYKRGEIWWTQFRISGKRYYFSTKTSDKILAKKIEQTIKSDFIRKIYDIPGKKNKAIFLDFWKKYIASDSSSKSNIDNKKFLSAHFLPVFKNEDAKSISVNDIENYRLKRKLEILSMPKNAGKKESEISFRTVNREITILHHFFEYCIKNEIIDKNPCAGFKKLNELSRLKTLSDKDIEKLINGATNKLTRDLITFLIYTGCRKGEALNLKWDDVDLQNDVIAVKGTKTKYDRYIPISKPLKTLLSGIEKNQDCLYVFNKNGAKLGDFKKSFHTACKNAGFKDMHIHDLRHVFASKMVMDGTSLYITGELLGHRTTQMTKRYSHLVPETLKKAVDEVWGIRN